MAQGDGRERVILGVAGGTGSGKTTVARAILRNSRQKILVADTTKFEVDAPVRICDIAEIDYFVTNAAPPESFQRAARQGQTHIITPEDRI